MNQAQSNSFKVTSQFFIQQLDTLIIQATRALAIEYGIVPDPDAKEMMRKILLTKVHALMSEESEMWVKQHVKHIRLCIKNKAEFVHKEEYELMKLMGLDNV